MSKGTFKTQGDSTLKRRRLASIVGAVEAKLVDNVSHGQTANYSDQDDSLKLALSFDHQLSSTVMSYYSLSTCSKFFMIVDERFSI